MSFDLNREAADYESAFDDNGSEFGEDVKTRKREKKEDLSQDKPHKKAKYVAKASSSQFNEEVAQDEGRRQRFHLLSLNAYDRHKKLVNDYLLYFPGATKRLQRDTSRDKTDLDVIKENHRFLWEDGVADQELTWGQRLAKKYCQKLFKEYCICDLSRYKENKVAMRWRTETEVKDGKGQFMCGSRKCPEHEMLRTWEVNFSYMETGEKKNTLVKVRLCPNCSYKLNYHHEKKEVGKKSKKEKKRKKKKRGKEEGSSGSDESESEEAQQFREEEQQKKLDKEASEVWSKPLQIEQEKSREEDFSEFLEDLFL